MLTTVKLDIQGQLLHQSEILAKQLNISQNELFQTAIEQFIEKHQGNLPHDETMTQLNEKELVLNQGDIYWLKLGDESSGIHHPYLIIQENVINHSRIDTVVVCALSSNLKRASLLGNVLLELGEANLPKQSLVEISKVSTVKKSELGEYIGSLSEKRVQQILTGMRFLQLSYFGR